MPRFLALCVFVGLACLLVPASPLAAATDPDRTQFNRDIRVEANDNVGDVTCIGCSVHVRGHVSGDVTTIAGSVIAEPGASIAGDLTTIGGSARLENGTQVAGDLTTIGGTLRRDPQAAIAGEITNLGGGGWILGIFLVPILFVGGIVALIIWLIQRSRRPVQVPAYTLHR